MIDFIQSVGAIGLVFGLVVFIHEFGHFLAAKMMGVYAPRFSIGFGRALLSHKWGETEYILAAIPLGGYVRMASRDDESMAFIEGGGEQPVPEAAAKRPRYWDPNGTAPFGPHPVPAHRWFESKSYAARFFILIAGVSMNVLLGFAVYTGIAAILGRPLFLTRVVGAVTPVAPGLAAGDTIVQVGGHPVASWNDIVAAIDSVRGDTVAIRTQRGVVAIPAGAPHGPARDTLRAAITRWVPPVVDEVVIGTPAQRAGMRAGDSVVAVDGVPVTMWRQLVDRIEPAAGRRLRFEVMRGAERVTLDIRPDSELEYDLVTKQQRMVGRIGMRARELTSRESIPFRVAVVEGATATWRAAGLVVESLRQLGTGQASFRQLGGPLAIGGAAVQAARRGWDELFGLLAFISVNIALLNLLPIPVLDGGQILLLGAEAVKGGALSLRTREYLMRAGIAVILLLLVVVMFNDIPKIVRSFFKQ